LLPDIINNCRSPILALFFRQEYLNLHIPFSAQLAPSQKYPPLAYYYVPVSEFEKPILNYFPLADPGTLSELRSADK